MRGGRGGGRRSSGGYHLSTSTDAIIEDTYPWSTSTDLDHDSVVGAVKSLSADGYVLSKQLSYDYYTLKGEAELIVKDGSQEIIVLRALCDSSSGGVGLTASELQSAVGKSVSKIGMGGCMKNKWAKREGDKIVATKGIDEVADVTRDLLMKLKEAGGEPGGFDPKVRRVSSFIILFMSLHYRTSSIIINDHLHQSSSSPSPLKLQKPTNQNPPNNNE